MKEGYWKKIHATILNWDIIWDTFVTVWTQDLREEWATAGR